jgi:hypothetical protein
LSPAPLTKAHAGRWLAAEGLSWSSPFIDIEDSLVAWLGEVRPGWTDGDVFAEARRLAMRWAEEAS